MDTLNKMEMKTEDFEKDVKITIEESFDRDLRFEQFLINLALELLYKKGVDVTEEIVKQVKREVGALTKEERADLISGRNVNLYLGR